MTGSATLGGGVKRLLMLACAATFLEATLFSAITPLLPTYTDELDLSKAAAGGLAASYAVGAMAAALPIGLLIARIGPKRALLSGLILMCVSSVAFALGRDIVLLDIARFFQGVAATCIWEAGLVWVVSAAPAARRNEVVGTVVGVGVAGTLMGPVVGGLADAIGTRPSFLAVAGIAVVLAAWATRVPGVPAEAGETASPRAILSAMRREPLLLAGVWLTVLPAALYGTLAVLAPLRLDDMGAGTLAIAIIFLLSAAVESALSPVFGRLCDRRGVRPALLGALGASIVVALILPLAGVPVVLGLLVVIAGAAFGMSWIAANGVLAGGAVAVGLGHSVVFALWQFGWAAGQTAGSAGGGGLADAAGDAVPYVILAALCAVTLAGIARWRERAAEPEPAGD